MYPPISRVQSLHESAGYSWGRVPGPGKDVIISGETLVCNAFQCCPDKMWEFLVFPSLILDQASWSWGHWVTRWISSFFPRMHNGHCFISPVLMPTHLPNWRPRDPTIHGDSQDSLTDWQLLEVRGIFVKLHTCSCISAN